MYRDILTHEQLESLDQEELHEQAKLDTLVKEVNLDQIFATLKSMAVAHISVSDTEML